MNSPPWETSSYSQSVEHPTHPPHTWTSSFPDCDKRGCNYGNFPYRRHVHKRFPPGAPGVSAERALVHMVDAQSTNKRQTIDEQPTNKRQTIDEQSTNNRRTTDEQPTNNRRTTDEQPTNNRRTIDEQSTNSRRTIDKQSTSNRRTSDKQSTNNRRATDEQPMNNRRTIDEQPMNNRRTIDEQPTNKRQTIDEQATNNRRATNEQATNNRQTVDESYKSLLATGMNLLSTPNPTRNAHIGQSCPHGEIETCSRIPPEEMNSPTSSERRFQGTAAATSTGPNSEICEHLQGDTRPKSAEVVRSFRS
ncbi:hypothetical protein BIW11_04682 [Tropilaelaps mercedesae]|uniref:Uncharacterized protein n=1 Tax=Tropilaelaps mercedesae TaxID=418985 RepID=A0A1V9X2Q0_9ACAR|nr:hypothetical protein BIW11_04682 [Tropilaelaps mercedesae]